MGSPSTKDQNTGILWRRDLVPEELGQLSGRRPGDIGSHAQDRGHLLAPFLVGHPDHGRRLDGRVILQDRLDLGGISGSSRPG